MTPAGTFPDGNGIGLAFEDADEGLDRLVHPPGWQNPQPRAPHLRNETVFGLTERPTRLLAIGAGPIGCELSQAIVQRALINDGVQLELTTEISRVSRRGEALVRVHHRRTRLTPGTRRAFERYFALARW
jgi:hypothetical protein